MEQERKKCSLRNEYMALLLLGILALAVRLYGISYGLPFPLKPDEPYIIDSAVGNLYSQEPLILGWPGTPLVLALSVLYGLGYLYLKATGTLSTIKDFIFMYWDDPTAFYLTGRLCVALTGALTVALLYRMCARIHGRVVALLSAGFLTFSFIHVEHSHFSLPDVPMTLLLVILVSLCHTIQKGAGYATYIIAGTLTGFSAALKFNSLVIILPILLAHFLREPPQRCEDWRKLLCFIPACLLSFYIGCPYLVTDPKALLESIRQVVLGQKDIGNARALYEGSAFLYLFRHILPGATGWPMVMLSVTGVAVIAVKPTRRNLVLISYPIIYLLLLSTSKTIFPRYAIPLVPFMAILSALAIRTVTSLVKKALASRTILVAASLAALLPQMRSSVLYSHMLTRTDTRIQARRWIMEHLPAGSRILLDHAPFSVPIGFQEWVLIYEMSDDRWGTLKDAYLESHLQEKSDAFELMYPGDKLNGSLWSFKPHYVIVSSFVRNIFYGDRGEAVAARMPDVIKRRRAFYERVEKEGELLVIFAPIGVTDEGSGDVYGLAIHPEPGPVIKIYRMRQDHSYSAPSVSK